MNRGFRLAVLMAFGAGMPIFSQSAPAQPLAVEIDGEPDGAAEAALNQNNVMTVRNVTRTEIVRGLLIYDAGGKPVGQVEHLAGNDVVVINGSKQYVLSFTDLFAYNQYGKDYFATRETKAALEQQAKSVGRKSATKR